MTTESIEQLRAHAGRLLQAGRVDEAIDAHQRLLALRPDLPDAWFNLAWLQRSARRFEDSLRSYAEALRRGVGGPEEAHVNRAAILSEHLERADEAEAELVKAVAANPRFPIAWLNLGQVREDRGDSAGARDAYAKLLELVPGNGRALARIAAIDLVEGRAAEVADRLRPLAADPRLPREDAAEIGFALGNALDSLGDYDSAFAAYTAANRAAREAAPPHVRYDRAGAERLVDALIGAFEWPLPAVEPSDGKPPIFICGMFRSGSTLAEQILARHSRVTAGGELEMLPALVHTQLQPYPQSLASAQPRCLEHLRAAYMAELKALFPTADVITDKRCDNFLHIGLIRILFPDARIVHTRRQPLDNILSVYFLFFDFNIAYGFDLGDIAHWYRQYERLMRHWKSLWPGAIHDLDYDAVVADPRPTIESLAAFCGLEWEDALLSAQAGAGPVRTASAWAVRQPLHTRSSGRWRNYEKHLGDVKAALGL